MLKINWKPNRPSKNNNPYVTARVGNVVLNCWSEFTKNSKCRWFASVTIRELGGTFRYGPARQLLSKTKEDAIRLACELLLDYHTSLVCEMKNFDLVVNGE